MKIFNPHMEKTEIRKKLVPGAREIIMQVKQATSDIDAVTAEINECKEIISGLIATEKSNSPKSKLFNELQQENEEKNALKGEKNNILANIDHAKSKITALRSTMESSNGYNSLEKLNSALEELELKLISTSVSQKEEIEISTKMSNLRIQKNKMSENEANHKLIESFDASIKEQKVRLSEINAKLNEKSANITALKEKLDKLSEGSNGKSTEVVKYETKLSGLKVQRDELFKLRNTLREKIHVLEEEFAKFEGELLVQKSLEEQKDLIKKTIYQLKADKESLLTEQGAYDPKIFDSLIFTIGKIVKSRSFSVNIDLVTQLMKFGIKIPSSMESLEETIAALNAKKVECSSTFMSKNQKVISAIAAIDAKIEAENAKMNELPATDFEILKKGGVRVGGFRNKDKF